MPTKVQPMKSQYSASITAHELKKRAELKTRPIKEQQEAAARNKLHQAKHHHDLRAWEAMRRREIYKAKFGPEAYADWRKARRERRQRMRAKQRAKEAYHSADDADQKKLLLSIESRQKCGAGLRLLKKPDLHMFQSEGAKRCSPPLAPTANIANAEFNFKF
ncbi:hypothetical protein C8R45DRAFT_920259 [Mycena sanguinolenta]|nr:hypothetical protein C8R45DRAFT_920259 [Mycena sanguinolenta]